ncbi:MAG: DegV family protein [Lachnospiraceae bacterium]|nr:DegV family protein [Lachnospiraceae bacterium]
MKDFVILIDAGADLNEELQKRFNLEVIQSHIVLPSGQEISSYLSWKDTSREEFYTQLKKNPNGYATAPANAQEFEDRFEKYIAEGKDVLCISLSSGISGTFNFACQAKKAVLEKHPDSKIVCIDSLRFGPGFGLMAVHASQLREEGKSIDEVADYLEKNRNRFHQMGWLDDLSFVAKKGRITHPKAFFGTLAGIKPMGEFDYNGLTTVIGKTKGEKAAYAAQLEYIAATIEEPEKQIIFIAQTNRMPQAIEYKRMIEERFHPVEVIISDVYPFCGINIGPGLMAAYYVGKPISQGLEEERELVKKILGK